MNEFSVTMRWACKENAEQNENSNQHTSLYYNIHLKSHASNSMSYIQHSNQINLDTQNCNLTYKSECKWVRNNTSKLQEQVSQETNQNAKQMFMSYS